MENIILFYGDNTYRIKGKVKLWEREFLNKHGDFNLLKLDGELLTAREIYEHANQVPFLGEKKLIIVNGFLQGKVDEDEESGKKKTDERKLLVDYLPKIAEFTALLFVETIPPDKRISLFKHLVKNCRTEEFLNSEGFALHDWIIKTAKKSGAEISMQEAKYLSDVAGIDMLELSNEIEKLSLNRIGKNIRKEDIDILTASKLAYSIFKLTDAIAAKNSKLAIKILEEMRNFNEEMPMIFHMIVRQFRIVLQIKDCIERNLAESDIRREIPEHPFVITNSIKQAKNFTMNQLKEIHTSLLKVERAFKSGGIKISVGDHSEFELALQKFVITHC